MNRQEATAEFQKDRAQLAARGLILPYAKMYLPDEWKTNPELAFDGALAALLKGDYAMDAQPGLVTDPNSAIPTMLVTTIDLEVIRVIFQPLSMAKIAGGERQSGTWLDETRMFPVIEYTGEVSSYGDYNNNGRAGVNMNWPQFQSYLYQTFISYGEREMGRAGLAGINYVSELNQSAAWALNQYQNLTYAFGVSGLQNYGLLNNPYLTAAITPATKAAGGTAWFTAGGAPNATANEVYNDVVALWSQIIAQTGGAVDVDAKATLALSPQSSLALQFANSFGVFVQDLLKKGFPNMDIKTAPQYGVTSATNPDGASTAGNFMQLILDNVQGQRVAYPAYNEKMRQHKLVPGPSDWKQKTTQGTWGVILRMPVGIASMLGI